MTTEQMENEFGYRGIIRWGVIVIILLGVIRYFSVEGAFIFMALVTLFTPIFTRAQINDWAYEHLTSDRESNERVIDSYKLKTVIYFSVGVLLGYTVWSVAADPTINIFFGGFVALFGLFAEVMIFSAIFIMIVQGLMLWAKPNLKQSSRRAVETYTPWALSAIMWTFVLFGPAGRKRR